MTNRPHEAEGVNMRLGALLPRAVLVALAWILATAAFTLAADRTNIIGQQPPATTTTAAAPQLTVPSVIGQAFVFAKGMLEDSGFGWRVKGPVLGYPGNKVLAQSPAAGTVVVDTGAPEIVLRLARGHYAQKGAPEDSSSYPATPIKLAVAPHVRHALTTPKRVAKRPKPPAEKKPAKKTAPATAPLDARPPAFVVKGAPKEPRDEITLTARADRLAAWVRTKPRRTHANVHRWLFQHAWIVDGANFGWSHGEQALMKLIEVDRKVERMWGLGHRSETVARAALAHVRREAR